jgi:hypothetical protein
MSCIGMRLVRCGFVLTRKASGRDARRNSITLWFIAWLTFVEDLRRLAEIQPIIARYRAYEALLRFEQRGWRMHIAALYDDTCPACRVGSYRMFVAMIGIHERMISSHSRCLVSQNDVRRWRTDSA